ncbi:MAG TPA: DoxX family protein [Myxococcota bacterium]|nr:DoxX family protein [Myxococcota bacterium]
MEHRAATRTYWTATALFCFLMLVSGAGDLLRFEPFVEDLRRLGYPLYVMTLLGVAKLFGVAALLHPGVPRLKEWAYAGFAFDLGGATISQLVSRSALGQVLPPLLCGVVLAASYLAYRRRSAASERGHVAPGSSAGRVRYVGE